MRRTNGIAPYPTGTVKYSMVFHRPNRPKVAFVVCCNCRAKTVRGHPFQSMLSGTPWRGERVPGLDCNWDGYSAVPHVQLCFLRHMPPHAQTISELIFVHWERSSCCQWHSSCACCRLKPQLLDDSAQPPPPLPPPRKWPSMRIATACRCGRAEASGIASLRPQTCWG